MSGQAERTSERLRKRLHEIIFEADTTAGKWFDVILLVSISASVLIVILESVESIDQRFGPLFDALEWFFTILFSIEYLMRLYVVLSPWRYATSFFGIIDLISILPTYFSLFFPGHQYFLVIRALRLLRIFRVFKLGHFLTEGDVIIRSLRASQPKITVFLTFIILVVLIIGSLMYLVEGGTNPGFSSIPQGMYWAIVTLTTVGYGDITPITNLGRFLSALVMILGYAVIAVPTGIVSAEFIEANRRKSKGVSTQVCRYCSREGHPEGATYCWHCGANMEE
jgi:voltage-gated potassium channel